MPEHTIAENLTRLQNAKTAIGNAITAAGGTVSQGDGLEEFATDVETIVPPINTVVEAANTSLEASLGSGSGSSTLITKTITANGEYSAIDDNALGYSSVTVNVSGGGVDFSNDPTSFTLLKNIRNLDVVIPNGITSIAKDAFNSCYGLRSVIISNTVTSIASQAFSRCTALTSIIIPDSVTSIGDNAFNNCTGLETFKFVSTSPPTITSTTFSNVPTTCVFYVPTGTLSAYTSAQYYPNPNTYTYVEY